MNYLRLIRPQHWIKNFFVLIPLFFGGELFDVTPILSGLVVFFAFSFVASSVYCYNDIVDADDDRHHPLKCKRPVASGAVSVRHAYWLMALMFVLGMATTLLLESQAMWNVMAVLLFYYVLNLAYCSKLKQYAILDVCIVAFGFVLRIIAGGQATDVELSKWIVLMTFLLTLFLSFAMSFKLPLDLTKARINCCSLSESRASTGSSKSPHTSVRHSSQKSLPTLNGASHAGHCNGKRFFISPISFQFFHKCTDRSYQSTVHRQRRIPVSKHLLLYGL